MGVAPMTMSPFASWLISAYDWRTAQLVIAVVGLGGAGAGGAAGAPRAGGPPGDGAARPRQPGSAPIPA